MEEIIGKISGAIVFLSLLPYLVRIYQRKITPNLTTWLIWSFIGLVLLLTYKSQGAKENIWPALFGFTNPVFVLVFIIWKKPLSVKLSDVERKTNRYCFRIATLSMVIWWFAKDNETYSGYANYIAIFADFCAVVPSLLYYWHSPSADRPGAWILFAIGYGLGIFAIRDGKVSDYVLPIYMTIMALIITIPLVSYRIRIATPLREWI
jgi:hypothetical protein